MAGEFGSLEAFAFHLASRVKALDAVLDRGLDRALIYIQKVAISEFGVYQASAGPHPGWPELAQATKDERVALGFTENDPLWRTGELQMSVTRDRALHEGVVGVKHGTVHTDYHGGSGPDMGDLMVWHEFGTANMPARPVLGPAGFRSKEAIQRFIGAAAVEGLIGTDLIHQALGYNLDIKDYGLGAP